MQFARITAPHVYRTQNVPAWWYRVYLFKYIRQLLLYTLCEFKPRAVSTPNRASASHWGPPIAGTPSSPRHPIVRRELARPASSDSRRRYFIIRKRTFSFITLTGFFFFFCYCRTNFCESPENVRLIVVFLCAITLGNVSPSRAPFPRHHGSFSRAAIDADILPSPPPRDPVGVQVSHSLPMGLYYRALLLVSDLVTVAPCLLVSKCHPLPSP